MVNSRDIAGNVEEEEEEPSPSPLLSWNDFGDFKIGTLVATVPYLALKDWLARRQYAVTG